MPADEMDNEVLESAFKMETVPEDCSCISGEEIENWFPLKRSCELSPFAMDSVDVKTRKADVNEALSKPEDATEMAPEFDTSIDEV